MGLLPLEFTDCLTDSPYFRENLHCHEKELERTSQGIKTLIKEVKDLLTAAQNLSKAQRNLAHSLMNFKFECIGNSRTDDEIVIAESLKEFGRLISGIEDERDRMLERASDQFIYPLETFRKEHIGGAKEGKKKFDKQTSKFCQSLERHANLSTKKNDSALQEADATLEMEHRAFQQASLEYIFLLQEVQERKKFEFVETILGFMYGWLTFYHQGHEVAKDFKPFMTELQIRLQKTRENFNATRDEAESLKNKMLEVRKTRPQDPGTLNKMYTRQGYLFLMERKAFGATWTKHYCQYQKECKIFTMMPYSQTTSKITTTETLTLKSCVRRPTESIDKRFCFDITAEDRQGIYTLQALSEEDRRLWMDAMDGKEPTYQQPGGKLAKPEETFLDDVGVSFVKKCIAALESRGLEDQGLYRLVGVSSKVNKLIQMGLDRRKLDKLSLDDALEWENKTITSALKTYFRNLPEPLMSFKLHNAFIFSAKQENHTLRVNNVHVLISQLPKPQLEMLDMLVKHLCNVAAKAEKNLMTVSNLGVCFGPTLLRPEEETVAAIMGIKFCNVVVEILIENYEKIFKNSPDDVVDAPKPIMLSPPKPPLANHTKPSRSYTQVSSNTHTGSQPPHTVSYNTDTPSPINTPGLPSPNSLLPAGVAPIAPARHRTGQKPIIVYNPAGPESTQLGSNSSSSTESISSWSSKEMNHHSSSNSSPQTSKRPARSANNVSEEHILRTCGKLGVHHSSTYHPADPILQSVKKRQSVDSALSSSKIRTLYHCVGENDSELSFEPNQIITNVRPSCEPGWLEGTLNGKTGLIPQNYVEYLP